MVEIIAGKVGYHLKIDGLFIALREDNTGIISIDTKAGIPFGTSEFISIKALKQFWTRYREMIIASTRNPYVSEYGELKRK